MAEQLYQVQLEDVFEGPMDLLVHLIKKNELATVTPECRSIFHRI